MGSGNKFRIGWLPSNMLALGVSGGRNMEHEWSFHIDLIKVQIYIGFGKGYDQR